MKQTEQKTRKEAVKLDEVLKSLFSTSKKVLINLLNGIFDENFHEDEVGITIANNEFIKDSYEVIRGDMFFEIKDSDDKKMYYHIDTPQGAVRHFDFSAFRGRGAQCYSCVTFSPKVLQKNKKCIIMLV